MILYNELINVHKWVNKWLMTFKTDECSVLSVDKNILHNNYTLNNKVVSHSTNKWDLGVSVFFCLLPRNHCITDINPANMVLGFTDHSVINRNSKISINSYLVLVRLHLDYGVHPHDSRHSTGYVFLLVLPVWVKYIFVSGGSGFRVEKAYD